uniref:Uncharacterized protein n=1 Tax=Opuntia streptacantha TaxID=393608 RepID=A0A7C9EIK9_OPUST
MSSTPSRKVTSSPSLTSSLGCKTTKQGMPSTSNVRLRVLLVSRSENGTESHGIEARYSLNALVPSSEDTKTTSKSDPRAFSCSYMLVRSWLNFQHGGYQLAEK